MNIIGIHEHKEERMDSEIKSTVYILSRSHAELTGISEVLSFDESSVELSGDDGTLCIEGNGIRIVEFDSAHAKIILDGRINGINYFDDMPREKKSGFFSRLFP